MNEDITMISTTTTDYQQLLHYSTFSNASNENYNHQHLLLMEADLFNSSVIEWILKNTIQKASSESLLMLVMITICYLIICLAGIVGNLITCIVIYKNKSEYISIKWTVSQILFKPLSFSKHNFLMHLPK
jgi:hypothetical protein